MQFGERLLAMRWLAQFTPGGSVVPRGFLYENWCASGWAKQEFVPYSMAYGAPEALRALALPEDFARKSKDLQARKSDLLVEMLDGLLDVFWWIPSGDSNSERDCRDPVISRPVLCGCGRNERRAAARKTKEKSTPVHGRNATLPRAERNPAGVTDSLKSRYSSRRPERRTRPWVAEQRERITGLAE
jgi:hypothetical protein